MSGNDNDQKKGFFDKPLSRRDILKLAGVGGAGLLLGAGGVGGIVAAQASKTERRFPPPEPKRIPRARCLSTAVTRRVSLHPSRISSALRHST